MEEIAGLSCVIQCSEDCTDEFCLETRKKTNYYFLLCHYGKSLETFEKNAPPQTHFAKVQNF